MAERRGAGRLRTMLSGALGGLRTRLELLGVEIEEERWRIASLLFNTVLAALFLGFGCVFLAVFATVWWWDSHRLLVLGLCALLFFALGLFTATSAARAQRAGSRLFSASLAELKRDLTALERDE